MTIDIKALKPCAVTVPIALIAIKITALRFLLCRNDKRELYITTAAFASVLITSTHSVCVFFVGYPKQEKLTTKI